MLGNSVCTINVEVTVFPNRTEIAQSMVAGITEASAKHIIVKLGDQDLTSVLGSEHVEWIFNQLDEVWHNLFGLMTATSATVETTLEDIIVEWEVSGRYRRATLYEPEEFPERDINEVKWQSLDLSGSLSKEELHQIELWIDREIEDSEDDRSGEEYEREYEYDKNL